ncbi:Os11g0108100, partial [Oryza sativa Japonica Group]
HGLFDMWGPRGSYVDSAATSDKTGVKTTEGPKMNGFVRLQVEGPSVYFFQMQIIMIGPQCSAMG